MTSLRQFQEENVVPPIKAGMTFAEISAIEHTSFEFDGKDVEGLNLTTEQGTFRTSSKPVIQALVEYFETQGNTDALTNVRVQENKSKKSKRTYLSLVPSE